MHGPTLREGAWAVERSPGDLHAPGAESLRTAWARGLAVVRACARDAGDVAAVDEALQAASRTLDAMESMARTRPASTALNMPSLVDATVNALTSLTDNAVDEGDPIGLLTWLLAQDSQLRARLDRWLGVLAALGDPPCREPPRSLGRRLSSPSQKGACRVTADSLVSLYWSGPDGYACLDEFLATNLPLRDIEAWWEAGIATADGAQCLQAAGIRPTQVRFADWVWDLAVIDLIVAALAPISWVADGSADATEIGPYEATAANTQYTVWHAGAPLGTRMASSRRRARQQAERWIRADARKRLPAWERLEPAR